MNPHQFTRGGFQPGFPSLSGAPVTPSAPGVTGLPPVVPFLYEYRPPVPNALQVNTITSAPGFENDLSYDVFPTNVSMSSSQPTPLTTMSSDFYPTMDPFNSVSMSPYLSQFQDLQSTPDRVLQELQPMEQEQATSSSLPVVTNNSQLTEAIQLLGTVQQQRQLQAPIFLSQNDVSSGIPTIRSAGDNDRGLGLSFLPDALDKYKPQIGDWVKHLGRLHEYMVLQDGDPLGDKLIFNGKPYVPEGPQPLNLYHIPAAELASEVHLVVNYPGAVKSGYRGLFYSFET